MKTILLAEDDPAHVALIRRALDKVGFSCNLEVVSSGAEVIDYLFSTGSFANRNAPETPDLLLLDLKLPKMDGLQVLQVLGRIRDDGPSKIPPVVVLTSSRNEADVAEAYRLGAHSFIPKPADFPQLVEAVRQIVQYWMVLNEFPRPGGGGDTAAGVSFPSG